MIVGVTDGWNKELQIEGVGYRAELQGNELVLSLGYSHPVKVAAPSGIEFEVDGWNSKKFPNSLLGVVALIRQTYIDANLNNQYDYGEPFDDINDNGYYDWSMAINLDILTTRAEPGVDTVQLFVEDTYGYKDTSEMIILILEEQNEVVETRTDIGAIKLLR